MEFILILVLSFLLVIAVLYVIFKLVDDSHSQSLENAEKALTNFTTTNQFRYGVNWEVLVDSQREKFAYLHYSKPAVVYDFKDIISVELVMNGKSISSKSLSDTIGGAALGGAIGGAAGAIIGGTSGKVTTTNGFTMLLVKVRLRSLDNPALDFEFGGSIDELDAEDKLKEAYKVIDLFTVIIDKVANAHLYTEQNKQNYIERGNAGNIASAGSSEDYDNVGGISNDRIGSIRSTGSMDSMDRVGSVDLDSIGDLDNLDSIGSLDNLDSIRGLDNMDSIRDLNNIDSDLAYPSAASGSINTKQPTISIADELLKLADLRDKGILTNSEFQELKTKLLNK